MPDNREIPSATTIASRKPRRARQLSSTQVMFAVILAIGLMLAFQYSSRITAERELVTIRETVLREIELLQDEQAELNTELAYVEGDAYVAQWARKEARMVRDGEILVVPIPSVNTIQQLEQPPSIPVNAPINTTIPEPETWEVWWALFFDEPPPQF